MKDTLVVITAVALVTGASVAQAGHTPDYHKNGDCQAICDQVCQDKIKQNEEGMGPNSCANGSPTGLTGYITAEARCANDPAGPQWNQLNCDANGYCQLWGTLKCPVYVNGVRVGTTFPAFDMSCEPRNGEAPAATLGDESANCIYSDSTGNSISCGSNGQAVISAW